MQINLLDASRLGLPYSHNPLKHSLHIHIPAQADKFAFPFQYPCQVQQSYNYSIFTDTSMPQQLFKFQAPSFTTNTLPSFELSTHICTTFHDSYAPSLRRHQDTSFRVLFYLHQSTSALCIPATFKEVVYTSTNLLAQVLHFMTPFDMVWVQAVCV